MKENEQEQLNGGRPYEKKTYFFIGAGAAALSIIAFGLAFSPLGIYSLIAAVLLSLGSLNFLHIQKKKNDFKLLKYVIIAVYAVTAAYILFFIGGVIAAQIAAKGN